MEADKDQVHVEIGLQYNDAYSESVSALPITSIPLTEVRTFPASYCTYSYD